MNRREMLNRTVGAVAGLAVAAVAPLASRTTVWKRETPSTMILGKHGVYRFQPPGTVAEYKLYTTQDVLDAWERAIKCQPS